MKYSIIEEIFLGNRGQNDSVKESRQYRALVKEIDVLLEELSKTLNEKQKKQLDIITEKQMRVESETAFTYYKEGLKIGLLMLAECTQD